VNILLVGEESAGIQTLRALTDGGHRIVAVMASQSKKNGGFANLRETAERLGYQTWPSKLVKDPRFADEVRAAEVDVILNIHSLFIINGEVVSAPRIGCFNMHPGPLPRYAGLNAVSWAIYRGETSHGVTIHKMEPGIDTGPIVYQELFDIDDADTGLTLSARCIRSGVGLVLRLMETASADPAAIPLTPQDLTKREYFGREIPHGGKLFWALPAREIVNFVRACDFSPFHSPWGHPQTVLEISSGAQEIGVVKARLTGERCDRSPGTVGEFVGPGVKIACGDEWVIVNKLKVEGRYVNSADVLKPGIRLIEYSVNQVV
jgi:methionyl-tRNA formyltransferase